MKSLLSQNPRYKKIWFLSKQILVQEQDFVKSGSPLSDGSIPSDYLSIGMCKII